MEGKSLEFTVTLDDLYQLNDILDLPLYRQLPLLKLFNDDKSMTTNSKKLR